MPPPLGAEAPDSPSPRLRAAEYRNIIALKNRIPQAVENAVLEMAIDQPAWGQVRVSKVMFAKLYDCKTALTAAEVLNDRRVVRDVQRRTLASGSMVPWQDADADVR